MKNLVEDFGGACLIKRLELENADLFAKLENLWRAVKPSNEYARALFPEFTPHDVLHLRRLFALSEQILTRPDTSTGDLKRFNATECFLLAAAIIAHDWGMGVSIKEQAAIVAGREGIVDILGPDGHFYSQPLLPSETRRLNEYRLSCAIEFHWNEENDELSNREASGHWRDYLRDTHPERSAERIRHHFSPHDDGIGRAIAFIAHGHGRARPEIENADLYAVSQPLNGHLVNLQALTLYLRLIDLLDIGKGRTPYELWRFVSPGNEISAKEWKKHHAMEEPVVEGEFIHCAARPAEGTILAEIFNLKRVCEEELEWQIRLLKLAAKKCYYYSFSHFEWKIHPIGDLNKTPVRFEFARDELLHLLSEEIYDGDPYVFIRELLQNAIDATRTRRERLSHTDAPLLPSSAAITVQTGVSGDRDTLTMRGAGTGITSYVIEHYLSVVGRSYYQSVDFRKLGLKFDPISRFGIGILSCFVLAEQVIIRTRTDPQCFASESSYPPEAWQIEIPAGRDGLPLGHWNWSRIDAGSMTPGTKITVTIDPEKFRAQSQRLQPQYRSEKLQVTEYLKTIACFVEIPIYIDEGDLKTVILHPKSTNEIIDPRRLHYAFYKLPLVYDFDEHITPLEVDLALEHVEIENIDLRDFDIPGIEGTLSYPRPIPPWKVANPSARELTLIDDNGETITFNAPKFHRGDSGFMEGFHPQGMCLSARRFKRAAVYFQGILVPDTKTPKDVGVHKRYTSSLLSFPNLFLNYIKPTAEHRLGPSRRSLRDSNEEWPNQIFVVHSRRQALKSRDRLLTLEPEPRLAELLRILTENFVGMTDFASEFGWDEWPVPILLAGGKTEVRLLRDLNLRADLLWAPRQIAQAASEELLKKLHYKKEARSLLARWRCPSCAFFIDGISPAISGYSGEVLKHNFHLHPQAIVLSPPQLAEGVYMPPPIADRWEKTPLLSERPRTLVECLALLQKGVRAPKELLESELRGLVGVIPTSFRFGRLAENYPKAFSRFCLWSAETINVEHPVGEVLCRAFCAYAYARVQNALSAKEQARLEALLTNLKIHTFSQPSHQNPPNSLVKLDEHLAQIKNVVEETCSLNLHYLPSLKLTPGDFMPGAFHFSGGDEFICLSWHSFPDAGFLEGAANVDFGDTLMRDSPWPPR